MNQRVPSILQKISLVSVAFFACACYNKDMFSKKSTIFLSLALAGGLIGSSVLAFSQGFAPSFADESISPRAVEETITVDGEKAELVLPESYEQYLPLISPVSFAMSEDYITIADGSTLYIYDRAANKYSEYQHKKYPSMEGSCTISKVQIAKKEGERNDRIFFSDTDSHLYEYGTEGQEALSLEEMIVSDVPVTTFLINDTGTALYTANTVTEMGTISLNRYTLEHEKLTTHDSKANASETGTNPILSAEGDTLFVSISDTTVVSYDVSSNLIKQKVILLDSEKGHVDGLQSLCAFGGSIFYTVKNSSLNGLYRTENGTATLLSLGENANDGLSALGVYHGELYCIRNKSVHKLSVQEDGEGNVSAALTDYEIGSSSDSLNRLNGATDTVRAGNLLVTANKTSKRILIRSLSDRTREQIDCVDENNSPYEPEMIATDGRIVAAASEKKVYLYVPYAGEYRLADTQECNNNITSVVCLYGACYFVTGGNGYGKIVRTASGESPGESIPTPDVYGLEGGNVITRDANGAPHALAYDLYGTIYVMYQNGQVRTFTEETFCDQGENGTGLSVTVPTDATSLRADFQGNLYYLKDGKMYCNGEEMPFAEIDGKDFVYTGEESKTPVSFALGFEDDEVYFLFGDFIVKSNAGALGFPSLGTISAEGIYDEVTKVHKKDEEGISLLDVKEHSIGIRVALEKLDKETASFPYSSYSRTNETERAVQLARTDGYRLVALYENKTYTVELFREEDLVVYGEEGEDPAFAPSWTGENGTRYFAVDTFVYNYPCLSAARTNVQLPRGTKVQLCDVVLPVKGDSVAPVAVSVDNGGGENGFKFAYVEYTDAEGNAAFGYLPLSFLSTIDPTGVQNETFTLGTLKENVSFQDENGERIDVAAGEEVMLYDNGDGTFTAAVERDGVRYTAQVNDKIVSHGESDALRIALIVILTALAVVIIGAYFFLLPRSKYGKKKN